MIRIDKYKVSLTGTDHDAIVLSFAWADAQREQLPHWSNENSRLTLLSEGISLASDGSPALLFPLSEGAGEQGVDRARLLELVSEHGDIQVRATDDQGDILGAFDFELRGA